MKPNALPPLADRYCTAINSLLRRELHAYTGELKRSAMARMAASPPEPDIVKGIKKVWRQAPAACTPYTRPLLGCLNRLTSVPPSLRCILALARLQH